LQIKLSLNALRFRLFLLDPGILTLRKVFEMRTWDGALSLLRGPLVSLSFERFLKFEMLGARRLGLLLALRDHLLAQVSEVGRHV